MIDTLQLQLRLPADKKAFLSAGLSEWMCPNRHHFPHCSGSKRDLLSFIGLLSQACKVVCPGRPFIRSLTDAATSVRFLDHRVHLNSTARQDLSWWHVVFLQSLNGVSVIPHQSVSFEFTSDASGSWGCEASF